MTTTEADAGRPPLRRSRRRTLAAIVVLAALVATAIGAGLVATGALNGSSSAGPTVWQEITAGIHDGTVPKETALEAFAYAYGVTIPGVQVPAGRDGHDVPSSGTEEWRWVESYRSELTAGQQAVIDRALAPAAGDQVVEFTVPGESEGPVPLTDATSVPHIRLADDSSLRDAIEADFAGDLARLGPKLGLPTIATGDLDLPKAYLGDVYLDLSDENRGDTLMTTFATSQPTTGHYTPCDLKVYAKAWQGEQPVGGKVSDRLHVLLTHEAVHCYQHVLAGSVAASYAIPSWIGEGTAVWLAADDTGIEEVGLDSFWRGWFGDAEKPLIDREYDAVGYFSLLHDLGRDLWSLMVPAWRAAIALPSDKAAASAAFIAVLNGDATDVLDAWAPSLLRRDDWAGAWVTHGFGLQPDDQVDTHPVHVLNYPATDELGDRSAVVDRIDGSEGEIVTVDTSGLASAHDEMGNEVLDVTSATFCTVESCVCKPGTARAGEDLAPTKMRPPFMLAVNAPAGGTTYTLDSKSLDDECGKQPQPSAPAPGGGGAGSGGGTAGGGGGAGTGETSPCATGCPGSTGDPHLTTVDLTHYDFQSAGEFVLLRSPDDSVDIQARQVPWQGSDHVSIGTAVAMRVGGHHVGLYDEPDGVEVHIDGAVTTVATPLDLGAGGRIAPYPGGYEIDLPDGTRIFTLSVGQWGFAVRIRPSAALAADGTGILGTVAAGGLGVPALPDGSALPATTDRHTRYTELYRTFADAWRVTPATSLFDYVPGASIATYDQRGFPAESSTATVADLTDAQRAAGEQACGSIVDADLHDDCVFDAATTGQSGFADLYAAAQSFDQSAAASPTATPASPSGAPPSVPGLGVPAGVTELLPDIHGLLGEALGPTGDLYVSVQAADDTYGVVATDPFGTMTVQVPLAGGGPVAVAAGSVWVGEKRPDGTCAIVRLDPGSLATAATIPVPCVSGEPAFAALGSDIWFVDPTAMKSDLSGAVLRRIDPSNQPSTTTTPITHAGGTLLEGTDSRSIVYEDSVDTQILVLGSTSLQSLGPLVAPVYGVSGGAWTSGGGATATLHGPGGVLATVAIDGQLVGGDDGAAYVDQPGDEDTLSRAPIDGSTPRLVAVGAHAGTAAGTTVDLGYADQWPLLIGQQGAMKLWAPTSRTDADGKALYVQHVALP